MANLTKLGQLTNDAVSAHRERARLFERLANLTITDEQRQTAIDEYAAAAAAFEKARNAVISAASKPSNK